MKPNVRFGLGRRKVRPLAVGLLAGAFALLTVKNALAQEAACGSGLVLGVSPDAAADITAAFCRQARARGLDGELRVSTISVGSSITVTATRTDASGKEQSARLQSKTIEEATRSAPTLVAQLGGESSQKEPHKPPKAPSPPTSATTTKTDGPPSPVPADKRVVPSTPTPTPTTRSEPDPTNRRAEAGAPQGTETPTSPETEKKEPVTRRDDGPTTHVKVNAPTRVQLQRNDHGTWVTTCLSPCESDVPSGSEYRIVDENGRAKSSFNLDGAKTTVEVSPRSTALDVIGTVVGVTGVFLAYGVLVADEDARPPLALTAVGCVTAGLIAILVNGSDVKVTRGEGSANHAGRAASTRERPSGPPLVPAPRSGITFPLLSLSF